MSVSSNILLFYAAKVMCFIQNMLFHSQICLSTYISWIQSGGKVRVIQKKSVTNSISACSLRSVYSKLSISRKLLQKELFGWLFFYAISIDIIIGYVQFTILVQCYENATFATPIRIIFRKEVFNSGLCLCILIQNNAYDTGRFAVGGKFLKKGSPLIYSSTPSGTASAHFTL